MSLAFYASIGFMFAMRCLGMSMLISIDRRVREKRKMRVGKKRELKRKLMLTSVMAE